MPAVENKSGCCVVAFGSQSSTSDASSVVDVVYLLVLACFLVRCYVYHCLQAFFLGAERCSAAALLPLALATGRATAVLRVVSTVAFSSSSSTELHGCMLAVQGLLDCLVVVVDGCLKPTKRVVRVLLCAKPCCLFFVRGRLQMLESAGRQI
ncbi:unnamed protein product [Polarella glacialis]|uniref:Uncharacterized protein n=1 Tax=Polarella glacialis TaxID=89957 RepID=A0A813G6Z0_POLGL|nr:unnamed protein product [Polarella glacialis]